MLSLNFYDVGLSEDRDRAAGQVKQFARGAGGSDVLAQELVAVRLVAVDVGERRGRRPAMDA